MRMILTILKDTMDFENLIKFGDIGLGIRDSEWIVFRYESGSLFFLDRELESRKMFIFWLPLLEHDFNDVAFRIDQILLGQNTSTPFANSFPINELIAIGLDSFSRHWINCSLNWLEQIGKFESKKIVQSLEVILGDEKIKTPLKHRIYKILRNSI